MISALFGTIAPPAGVWSVTVSPLPDKLAAVLLLPRQGEEEESLFYLAGIERKAADYQVRRRMHRFVF